MKVTPEIALTKASDKFVKSFQGNGRKKQFPDGKDMAELSAKELMNYGEFVKRHKSAKKNR